MLQNTPETIVHKDTAIPPEKQAQITEDAKYLFGSNGQQVSDPKMLPIWGLNIDYQNIIESVECTYSVPREFAVCSMLSAVCTAVGKRAKLITKFVNFPNLWFVFVAPSGTGKSHPLKFFYKPILAKDKELHEQYIRELRQWEQSNDKDSDKGDKPQFHCLTISDSTPEARNETLSYNPNGIAIYRDEIKGLFDDFGRYNPSGEVSQMLSIFDNEQISVTRKQNEPLLITEPLLNIIGTIQPEPLQKVFGRKEFCDTGLQQRFLLAYPQKVEFPKYTNETISHECVSKWSIIIDTLLRTEAREYRLNCDVEAIYSDYYNETQEIIKCADDDYLRAIYCKLQIHVLRFALTVAVLNGTEITAEVMCYSIECMRYFEYTAKRVYELGYSPKTLNKSEAIKNILELYPDTKKADLAKALNITKQSVNSAINK